MSNTKSNTGSFRVPPCTLARDMLLHYEIQYVHHFRFYFLVFFVLLHKYFEIRTASVHDFCHSCIRRSPGYWSSQLVLFIYLLFITCTVITLDISVEISRLQLVNHTQFLKTGLGRQQTRSYLELLSPL
jgi:hypothetical protein